MCIDGPQKGKFSYGVYKCHELIARTLYQEEYCSLDFNPLKPSVIRWLSFECSVSSRSNLHFQFRTFGHSGAQGWAPECPYVRNWQVAQLWQRDRASSINDFRWGVGQFEAIIDWGVTFRAIATWRNLRLRIIWPTNHFFYTQPIAAEYRSRRRRRRCANNIAADHQCW